VPNIPKKHSLSLPIVNQILAEDFSIPNQVTPYLVEEKEEVHV
jgi:hypothetical protein